MPHLHLWVARNHICKHQNQTVIEAWETRRVHTGRPDQRVGEYHRSEERFRHSGFTLWMQSREAIRGRRINMISLAKRTLDLQPKVHASSVGPCSTWKSFVHRKGPTRQPRIKKIEGDLKANRRYTEVSFGETKVRMQLDSGVDVTVINREAWEQIGSPTLEKTTTSLGAANGTPIEVLGQFDVQFTCGGHSGHGRCYVAENIEQLLGIEWMNQLPPLQKAFNAICCKMQGKPEEEGRHLAKVLAGGFPDVFR